MPDWGSTDPPWAAPSQALRWSERGQALNTHQRKGHPLAGMSGAGSMPLLVLPALGAKLQGCLCLSHGVVLPIPTGGELDPPGNNLRVLVTGGRRGQ